jgi:hypothetical protein
MDDITTPIAKEQLQKGFLIKKEININIENKFIKEYIDNEIKGIIRYIINNTIDETLYNELQKDTKIEYTNYEDEETGENIELSQIVKKNEKDKIELLNKIKERQRYIYYFKCKSDGLHPPHGDFQKSTFGYLTTKILSKTELDNIKDQIYSKVKEIFPDCIIQIDPLKTYILIDWN